MSDSLSINEQYYVIMSSPSTMASMPNGSANNETPEMPPEVATLKQDIAAQGDLVRELKAKDPTGPETKAAIEKLQQLKDQLPIEFRELSKSQLKKLAKGKDVTKKKNKETKAFNPPSKKKKAPPKSEENFVNTTPPGEKKDMTGQMAQAYNPEAVEAAWDAWWEKQGYYTTEVEAAKKAKPEDKFVIVIPPPNVTGTLHIGHALTCSIEDALARWHRMCGRHVMWLPGTDHAGIATQAVVEKKLMREEGLTRHDIGREKFLERVWEWKEEKGTRILNQLRRLGASVDHSRTVFTMDETRSQAVTEAFIRMYEAGLIYRGTRLVNWSHALNTAISDIEVDTEELEGRTLRHVKGHDPKKKYEFGTLTSFAYKIADEDGNPTDDEIVVATTRLETMLGDTAVAIHPEDKRYEKYHGKFVVHPFNKRKLPIVLDDILVDKDFGTGCVKITPAHDENDYLCGLRHNLPMISILNDDGTINGEGGDLFQGMMRFDARIKVEEELKKLDLYRDKVDNKMQIPICSRSGDIIEKRLKPQWWVNCKTMAARSIEAVEKGDLKILPDMHVSVWYRWLVDIREWCISRQLWWGHRIPAYKVEIEGDEIALDEKSADGMWVVAHNEDEAKEKAIDQLAKAGKTVTDKSKIRFTQDPDVLDTWFSSGLFPFSGFGWPEETDDMKAFFPGTLLETGHDILFFWVARMVMMSLQLTDKLPFTTVYLHAMVRDRYGRKMSKSLGNIIDPVSVIEGITLQELHDSLRTGNLPEKEIKKAEEGQKADYPDGIPQCGADALRFGLLAYTVQGRDVNLDINRVAAHRRFCNKLWQVTKFLLMNLGDDFKPIPDFMQQIQDRTKRAELKLATRDEWLLGRLAETVIACNEAMRDYLFANATSALYTFWLERLCDVYVESIKPVMYGPDEHAKTVARNTLWYAMDYGLKLMHPIMPFVTEELWQRLPGKPQGYPESIVIAPYPKPEDVANIISEQADVSMNLVNQVAGLMRSLAADFNLNHRKDVKFFVHSDLADARTMLKGMIGDVDVLGRGVATIIDDDNEKPAGCSMGILDSHTHVHILLKGMLDVPAQLKKLEKELDKEERTCNSNEAKLGDANFLSKANEEAIEKCKLLVAESKGKIAKLQQQINEFRQLL